jgi:2,4-dienoyl-CoA reductase-like NADH-dependent reductase (Old Yellow Enzyme family)
MKHKQQSTGEEAPTLAPFVAPWDGYAAEDPGPAAQRGTPRHVPHLFTPLKIRDVTFKNRTVVSPMCTYTSVDGLMNDWHLTHLGAFAKGGAGLVVFEASGVQDVGRITPWDAGVWKDEHIAPLKRIVDFVHSQKARAGLQIAHAGRKASTYPPHLIFPAPGAPVPVDKGGWVPVGPSPIAWDDKSPVPHELTKDEIQAIVQAFADAAVRADKAGFDVVEIHGAHGYLISSFNSPLANHRTDEYGGSFENRTRFVLEVVRAVRKVWPASKPLFLRLSSSDWVEGGTTVEDTVRLAKLVKAEGVDLVDCSSGGQSPAQKISVGPLYQLPFAEQVKREADVLTGAVGLIVEPVQAEEIIFHKRADFVFLGRELLRDPFWVLHAAKELKYDIHWPVQHEWAVNRPGPGIANLP